MKSATSSFRLPDRLSWVLAHSLLGGVLFLLDISGYLWVFALFCGIYQLIWALLQIWILRKSGLPPIGWGLASFLGLYCSVAMSFVIFILLGPGQYEPNDQVVFFQGLLDSIVLGVLYGVLTGGAQTIAFFLNFAKKWVISIWIPASMLAFGLAFLSSFLLRWHLFGRAPLLTTYTYLGNIALGTLSGTLYGTVTVFPLAWIISKRENES